MWKRSRVWDEKFEIQIFAIENYDYYTEKRAHCWRVHGTRYAFPQQSRVQTRQSSAQILPRRARDHIH